MSVWEKRRGERREEEGEGKGGNIACIGVHIAFGFWHSVGVLKQIQKDKGTTVLLTNTQECDILSQEDLKQGEGMEWISEWEIFSKAELERAA